MPLPFQLNHINLWLIEDGDGWVVIDTGVGGEKSRALWQRVFDGPLRGRPLTQMIATHYHPDHMGLAAWLVERFGLLMQTTLPEWLMGRMLSLDGGQRARDASLRFYASAGADGALLEAVAKRGNAYMSLAEGVPATFRRILEDEELVIGGKRWRVVVGRGHSPLMACLLCEELGLFISGDQVLPSITPNVSVWPSEPEGDPLTLFLKTMKAFRALPDDVLVLPSHGTPFIGLHGRIEWVEHHHDARLAETLDGAASSITTAELLKVLFPRELDAHQIYFALGETLAHLNHLLGAGKVARETDANGVHHYRRL
jgi:glyoxylase-like metal-dependent hydrolase (beta-lactamase superfamily II)